MTGRTNTLTLFFNLQVRHSILIELCVTCLLLIQVWIPMVALKKTNVDEFMVENQRTHTRQNYVVQRANDDVPESDNIGVAYATELLSPRTNPEELPALIVDYANMIRNDIILLDKSVETRTRKRGNIKRGVHEIPCSCEERGELRYLGPQYVPSTIESRICNKDLCSSDFGCQIRMYNITVLKKKERLDEDSSEELPDEIRKHWVAVKKPITIACFCTNDYRERY
ncbi:prothoracicotropic hormone-like isoform X2 [Colias croceus]|uniref:prothoracicotropic hormone-like isoform X2 n=1 Tax=Colias crocea TaxID=72248 RepID=UPI001E281143|nr:prothoracicotropic hormone-like isoform X2 [Colias croceus]